MAELKDFARLLRSKNAGPFLLTIDVMMGSLEQYRHVIDSNALTADVVGALLGADPATVKFYYYEPAFAIKVTVPRHLSVGDPLDNDLFGGQLFGPLARLAVPDLAG